MKVRAAFAIVAACAKRDRHLRLMRPISTPSTLTLALLAPLSGKVLTIVGIRRPPPLTYTRGRVRMQKFAFKSPVNAWVQGNATAKGCPGPRHRVSA